MVVASSFAPPGLPFTSPISPPISPPITAYLSLPHRRLPHDRLLPRYARGRIVPFSLCDDDTSLAPPWLRPPQAPPCVVAVASSSSSSYTFISFSRNGNRQRHRRSCKSQPRL
ncbi:GGDEF domain-containing protein [Sesbania bispinosa]|nr:GGDEF domain-containing protein [Sesbania bispinosa]